MLFAAVVLLFSLAGVWGGYDYSRINGGFTNHKNFKLLNFGDTCGTTASRDIIKPRILGRGGGEADLGQYPWMARLRYKLTMGHMDFEGNGCGGVIISDQYILTAAHCQPKIIEEEERKKKGRNINVKVTLLSVRLGEHDERKDKDCDSSGYCLPPPQDVAVASYKCHQLFNPLPPFENDICIIKLAKKIEFSDSVQPICLPFYDKVLKDPLERKEVEVAGWGIYKYRVDKSGAHSEESSPVLLRMTVSFIDEKECNREMHNRMIPSSDVKRGQICGVSHKNTNFCSGDSGGPMMKRFSIDGTPRSFLLGIVSWMVVDEDIKGNSVCRTDGSPGVYADVRYYLKWILDNLPTNSTY